MSIDFAQELNQEQLRVVQHGDGPCLVLAGAGTGKTRTIVYRVAYLLEHGVAPDKILLVTFTNKAAREMLSRVETLISVAAQTKDSLLRAQRTVFSLPWAGTFHHVGSRTLRLYGSRIGIAPSFTIMDAQDNLALVKAVMIAQGMSAKKNDKYVPAPDLLENLFSFSVNSLRPLPELIAEWIPKHKHLTPEIVRIAAAYEQKKQERNILSFDDLLSLWLRVLRERPEVRQSLGGKFEYF